MEAQLAEIAAMPQQRKAAAFRSLLAALLTSPDPHQLCEFTQAVSSDTVGLVISKQVLTELVDGVTKIENLDIRKPVVEGVLCKLSSRVVSFEEQVSALRLALATIHEGEENWTEAARALQGIPLDSGHRAVPDDYKLGIYVRILRLFLEDDDAVSAETYYNRASLLIHFCQDAETILHFKLAQARILDSKRRFVDAAARFHELSYVPTLAEGDRLRCLSASVTCAILAPAGPARSRILATLCRDERAAGLSDYTILRKMFLDQIIRPSELTDFESRLAPHQLAKLPPSSVVLADEEDKPPFEGEPKGKKGPETVFDRAVMQHNLLAASRIYANITFRGLGALVGLTPIAAEIMARTMIQERRLRGRIDQVEGLITFEPRKRGDDCIVSNVAVAGEDKAEEDSMASAPATARWDEAIRATSQKVEVIAEQVTKLMEVAA